MLPTRQTFIVWMLKANWKWKWAQKTRKENEKKEEAKSLIFDLNLKKFWIRRERRERPEKWIEKERQKKEKRIWKLFADNIGITIFLENFIEKVHILFGGVQVIPVSKRNEFWNAWSLYDTWKQKLDFKYKQKQNLLVKWV